MHINCLYVWGIHSKLTFFFRIFAQFTTHFNVSAFLFKLQVKYFSFPHPNLIFSSPSSLPTFHFPHSHTNTVCLALEHIPDGQEHLHKIDSLFFCFVPNWINKCCHSTLHNTTQRTVSKPHCLLRSFPRAWQTQLEIHFVITTREWKSKQSHPIRHIIKHFFDAHYLTHILWSHMLRFTLNKKKSIKMLQQNWEASQVTNHASYFTAQNAHNESRLNFIINFGQQC